jgi:hypothetical protein
MYSREVAAQMEMAWQGLDAGVLQGGGDTIHHRVEGGEGDRSLAFDQRRMRWAGTRMRTDQLAIADKGAGEQIVQLHSALRWRRGACGTFRSLPSGRPLRCSG